MSIIYSPYVTGTISGTTRKIRSYLDYEIAETNTSYSVTFSAGLDAPHAMSLGPNPTYPTVTVSAEGQTKLSKGKTFSSGNSGDSLQYVPASGTVTWIWEKVATPQSVIIKVAGSFGTSSAFKGKTPTVTLPFTVPAGIIQPEVNDLLAFRTDASGQSDIEGTYARIQANLTHARYYDLDSGWSELTPTITIEVGSSTLRPLARGTSLDYTSTTEVVPDVGSEYTVTLTTSYEYDGQTITATRSTRISASNSFVLDFMPDGTGMAIGNVCRTAGLHIHMATDFKSQPTVNGSPIGGGGVLTLLWENASPNSQFTAQTVNVDLTSYDQVRVDCNGSTNASYGVESSLYVAKGERGRALGSFEGRVGRRQFATYDNRIEFQNAGTYNSYGSISVTTKNSMLIPVRIYGVRG